jgi:hypothetical protein
MSAHEHGRNGQVLSGKAHDLGADPLVKGAFVHLSAQRLGGIC